MAAGIRIINDWGTVQIDESYRNLFLRTKGQGGVIPVNSLDMCAIQPDVVSGNYISGAAVSGNTKWWLFALLPATAPGTFGLKIWDAAGKPVFDTSQQPLRIVDVVNAASQTIGSKSYPAGRLYAVVIGTFGWKTLKESVKSGTLWTNTTTHYRMGVKVVGTTVTWDWFVWYIDGPWKGEDQSIGNGWTYSTFPTVMMVVDVTNY